MVGLCIRGRHVACIALGLGAAACQLALNFDYQFDGVADAGGVPDSAGLGGSAGASGAAGSAVSEGNGGGGVTPAAAGSGPAAPGAGSTATAGTGGVASSASGAGGSASTAGTGAGGRGGAGSAAGGSAAGSGTGGSGGTAVSAPACTGCVEIIAAFGSAHPVANFQIERLDPSPALDFTAGVIEWTIQAQSLDPLLGLKVSVQNGAELGYVGLYTEPEVPLVEPSFGAGVWVTLQLDVAAFLAGTDTAGAASDNPEVFDASRVRVLGLELGMRSDVEGPVELHLLIDRVGISGVPGVDAFELSDGLDGFVLELPPDGAQVIHHPSDAG